MAQDAINQVLIDRAQGGQVSSVRLKGGDPFVFARGYEEVATACWRMPGFLSQLCLVVT